MCCIDLLMRLLGATVAALHRTMLIVEASASNLGYILLVLVVVLMGFCSAEYLLYGFKSSATKTWLWGFLNRLVGIFSGDPVIMSHAEHDRILGVGFNIVYVLIFSVLLLSLVVAMLSAGYDQALAETSDGMAKRQYHKLRVWGFVEQRDLQPADLVQAQTQLDRIRKNRESHERSVSGYGPTAGRPYDEAQLKQSSIASPLMVVALSGLRRVHMWPRLQDCWDRANAACCAPASKGNRCRHFGRACCCLQQSHRQSRRYQQEQTRTHV